MKKKFTLIVLAGLFIVPAYNQTPATDPHWNKTWEDEFLNLNNWYLGEGPHKKEDIYVFTKRPENVYLSNGRLVLQALRKDTVYNGKLYHYTSGGVANYTPGLHFGYIESKMKLPYGKGFWPAFWTWTGAINASNAGEIDIFEMTKYPSSTTMGTNLHMYYCNDSLCDLSQYKPCNDCKGTLYKQECPNVNPAVLCYGQDVTIPSYANIDRVYGLEWTPTKFIWYVDGVAVRNFPNPGIIDPVWIYLNLALIHWWPDAPDNTTPFPAQMEIDYVRIYKLKCDGGVINNCSYNFNTYNNKVKQSITIGGNGCSNSLSPGDHITMRATDFIEIKGDFYAPVKAELYLDVNPIAEPCTKVISEREKE